jgi:hypothetical protein
MKKLFAAILLMATFTSSFAQVQAEPEMSDASRICLSTLVDPKVPTTAHKMLTNRLEQIIMKNGLAGSKNQRFVLGASVTELGKETTQTAPIMYIVNLSINFVIGDAVDGTKFAAASMEVNGIGSSENKAYTDALKKIKTTDPIFKGFIAKGKESIIKYFESNCEFIMKEASTLADQKEYDKAISMLMQVPNICVDCYNRVMDASVEIYKRKIENDCQINISNAKAAMAANQWDEAIKFLAGYTPDIPCYSEVGVLVKEIQDHRCADALARAEAAWASRDAAGAAQWLAEVSADSKCYADAQKLQKAVGDNLDAVAKQEWEFKLKQHQDEVNLEKMSIQAIRDIGVAYAENQPTYVYNTTVYDLWW